MLCGLPVSTTHRLIDRLVARGYVIGLGRGRYGTGSAVLPLVRGTHLHDTMREVARPFLAKFARATRTHAHLGVLENDMVTYLIKVSSSNTSYSPPKGRSWRLIVRAWGKYCLRICPETSSTAISRRMYSWR
jgi:DNA-binding IclR family transcriptional regulator